MYIELVRDVILQSIERHVKHSGLARDQVLQQIREHILNTSDEYWNDVPTIAYDQPLCRLGYLYMNAPANATLFERVLLRSADVRAKLSSADQDALNICSLGGGPGTELLGLTKYYLQQLQSPPPRKIGFTVVDNVKQWADTWLALGEAAEKEMASSLDPDLGAPPTIAPMFWPGDVFDHNEIDHMEHHLERADLVVFNYLFSENKTRLPDAKPALTKLKQLTVPGCCFVVIDRLEQSTQFRSDVVHLFEDVFGVSIQFETITGTLDGDEQVSEMGDMLMTTLDMTPRIVFRTKITHQPTVFWFVVTRS